MHGLLRSRRLLSITALTAALASALAVTSWATRPSFNAKFGPVDDHEPLIWMGPDRHLPWTQFWTTLIHKTEVGEWGHTGRFRPAYYALRVAETVVLGNHPASWYAGVLVLFAGTCGLLGYVAAVWLQTALDDAPAWIVWPLVVGGAATAAFLFAGLYAWSGIVGRLGPAEQLGLAAAGVVLLSLTKLSLGLSRRWWILALLGVTTATFAKEGFASFCLAFPLAGTYSYLAHGRRRSDLVAGLLGLLPAVVLAAILAPTLLHNQHDVYGTGVGASRLSKAVSALGHAPVRESFTSTGVLLFAWAATAATVPRARRRVSAFLLVTIVWLVACIFLDDWFYGGSYPLPRYRAILDLVVTVQFVGAACLSIAACRRSRGRSKSITFLAVAALVVSVFFLHRLVPHSESNLRLTHENAIHNAATSNEYQHDLSATLARWRAESKPPVAVVATVGIDYEFAFAVLNEFALRTDDGIHEYLIVDRSPQRNVLLDAMRRLSRRGERDWHARPLRELGGNTAICVFINVRPHALRGCRPGDGIRLLAQGM